MLQNMWIYTSD